jgi:hypothetical protein
MTAKTFLKSLFARFGGENRGPAQPRQVKLNLEDLEERMVLSGDSLLIHAVTDVNNNSVVVYRNQQDGGLYMRDPYWGAHQLLGAASSGGGPLRSFSVGLDVYGYADVWVKASDTSFWEWRYWTGWEEVLGPGNVGAFAAVMGDRVYFGEGDGSLWGFARGVGLHQLDGAGAVASIDLSIDAVTDNFGQDAVFADHPFNGPFPGYFGEYYNGGYQFLNGTAPRAFSAGVDITGHADVYFATNTSLLEDNSYLGRLRVLDANAGIVYQLSATSNEEVYVLVFPPLASDQKALNVYDQNGTKFNLTTFNFTEISAANNNDVYTVISDKSGWEVTGGYWSTYGASGTVY